MPPDRLRQIEELYHAVRESSADRHAALLAEADSDLRREVEALLACQDESLPTLELRAVAVTQPGTRLGPYLVENKLGEGGMGEVFRAVDTRLGRAVAIKVVHRQFDERFEREARAISSLNHPHICILYDIGPNYLVMEYVEGTPLKGPLPVDDGLKYAEQICDALRTAHQKGIIHRDLKPGNILLAPRGIKLLDFGLAQIQPGPDDPTLMHLTQAGVVMGTPGYMAPEQREGRPSDARTDIYSFGCVLYEMLTGTRAMADRKPLPSGALEAIVARCLETDPARRWQSTAELAHALEAARLGNKTIEGTNRRRMVPAVAIFAVALIGGSFAFRSAMKPAGARKLTDKDTIVLADFVNNTSDPVFDDTLRQGLAIQLEQSPFLKIMDDERAQSVARLMNLAPGAHITNQVAKEICVREGAAATIGGTIGRLGKTHVITLQANTCGDGATLAREQVEAEDKEHVLSALGSAATAMRARLGESLSSIQKLNLPLEKATTGSLEALRNYTAGNTEISHGRFLAAVPLFERAITLDPNFAMAYHFLALALYNAGDAGRSVEYDRKALELIDRVSEFERDNIAASYYESTRELDKAIDGYRLGIANYPRFWGFHNNLSTIQIDLGRFEEGLLEGEAAARLQPDVEPPWRRQLDALMCLDRLDEARKLAEKVRMLGIDGARIHQRFLEMAYIGGDQAAVAREIQWYAGKPEEYLSSGLQAANRNVLGQREESGKLYRRAAETARHQGLRDVAAGFEEANARADVLSGNCRTARQLGRPALALAMCGDGAQAEKLAGEISKRFPNGTLWNAVQLPEIRAAIALQGGQPAKAVELLSSASPYERAYPEAVYLRGLAYLRLRKGAEAAAEFHKITDHKGASWGSTWLYPNWGLYYSISYLGLARGSALAGDTANARKAFQDFLQLWKDADPDLPILRQAKAEYAGQR